MTMPCDKKKRKKGAMSLQDMYPLALTILILIVTVGIGLRVLEGTADNLRDEVLEANDTFEADFDTYVALDHDNIIDVICCWNTSNGSANESNGSCASDGPFVAILNYSYHAESGLFSLGSNHTNHTNISCNYTYNKATVSTNNTLQGVTSLTNISNWYVTFAILIASAVVVGLIVMYFRL